MHGWRASRKGSARMTGAFPTRHLPGQVLADLVVAIADGGDALTHLATLRDQGKLFGEVASEPTAWRAVERVDEAHLDRLRAVRAAARERAWAAGAGPDISAGLTIDLDATISVAHREAERGGHLEKYVRPVRCWPTWTSPMCPAGKPSQGCCAPATRAATPPPTTSRCWTWRSRRCPAAPGRRGTGLAGGPSPH
jgi:hypothetical protein